MRKGGPFVPVQKDGSRRTLVISEFKLQGESQEDTVTMAILPGIGIIAVFLLIAATFALGRQGFNHLLRYRDRTNPI
jgi:hypothetical protein